MDSLLDDLRRLLEQDDPTTQARQLLDSVDFTEVRLREEQRQEFFKRETAWTDLMDLLASHHVVWMCRSLMATRHDQVMNLNRSLYPRAAVVTIRYDDDLDEDGNRKQPVRLCATVTRDDGPEEEQEVHSVLEQTLLALAKKPADEVRIESFSALSEPGLDSLLTSNHKRVGFARMSFAQDRCERLAAFHGGSLSLLLCHLEDRGKAIWQEISQNRGPTELALFATRTHALLLQTALGRSTSLKSLAIHHYNAKDSISPLIHGLRNNTALREFHIGGIQFTECDWVHMVQTLLTRPALQKMSLGGGIVSGSHHTDDDRVRRTLVIVDALKKNQVLTELVVNNGLIDPTVNEDEILPRLEANVYRKRSKSLLEEKDEAVRNRLFNRVVTMNSKVMSSSTLQYIFLCDFHELLVQLEEARLKREQSSG